MHDRHAMTKNTAANVNEIDATLDAHSTDSLALTYPSLVHLLISCARRGSSCRRFPLVARSAEQHTDLLVYQLSNTCSLEC